jgi:hypothetical protein
MRREQIKTPHVCVLTHPADKSHLDSRDFGSDFLCPNTQKGVCVAALGNTNVYQQLWATLMCTGSFGHH